MEFLSWGEPDELFDAHAFLTRVGVIFERLEKLEF